MILRRSFQASVARRFACSTSPPSLTSPVDLRSDTVTLPCPGMREAMATARLGDDVFQEDPTTRELEARGAALLGMEAGLFLPSGTMANLLAVLSHCTARGQEVLLGSSSHLHLWEQGGLAQLGGVHSRTLQNREDGSFCIDSMSAMVQGPEDPHSCHTRLVAIENSHNAAGGTVLPLAWLNRLASTCSSLGLLLHCDGARLLHSATHLSVPPSSLLPGHTSATLCLSKGLGAPVGSLLLSSKTVIESARRLRKALGGGMRQTGVLAAAGLYGLEHVYPRLGEEHAKAARLSACIEGAGRGRITVAPRQTNIVLVQVCPSVCTAQHLVSLLQAAPQPVLSLEWAPQVLRLVTHRDISSCALERAEDTLYSVIEQLVNTR